MLRIHLFSIFTIKTPQALNREDTDKCTPTKTSPCTRIRISPCNCYVQVFTNKDSVLFCSIPNMVTLCHLKPFNFGGNLLVLHIRSSILDLEGSGYET